MFSEADLSLSVMECGLASGMNRRYGMTGRFKGSIKNEILRYLKTGTGSCVHSISESMKNEERYQNVSFDRVKGSVSGMLSQLIRDGLLMRGLRGTCAHTSSRHTYYVITKSGEMLLKQMEVGEVKAKKRRGRPREVRSLPVSIENEIQELQCIKYKGHIYVRIDDVRS